MADYMVISADSHANEPVELYERLPEEYRPRAPREIIKDGHRYLRIEGAGDMPLDAPNPLSEEDMRRFFRDAEKDQELIASNPSDLAGGVDIPVRLSDLEDDGVSGEVIYPQGIFKSFASPDPGYQRSAYQAVQRLVPRNLRGASGQVCHVCPVAYGRHRLGD